MQREHIKKTSQPTMKVWQPPRLKISDVIDHSELSISQCLVIIWDHSSTH